MRYFLFCALSGCVWALVALAMAWPYLGSRAWGGVMAAPLIGIFVGALYRPAYDHGPITRGFASLLTLSIAITMFAIGVGFGQLLAATATHREPMTAWILGTWWGVTCYGYLLFLWPLAWLNHRLLGPAARQMGGWR